RSLRQKKEEIVRNRVFDESPLRTPRQIICEMAPTAPAARFATIRLGAYSESDHAGGWDGPARIRFAPVSPDNHPSRVDREFPGRQIALLIPRAGLPIFGVRRSHRSGAKPTPQAGCRAGANGNSGPILRAKLFRRCRRSGFVAPVPSNE